MGSYRQAKARGCLQRLVMPVARHKQQGCRQIWSRGSHAGGTPACLTYNAADIMGLSRRAAGMRPRSPAGGHWRRMRSAGHEAFICATMRSARIAGPYPCPGAGRAARHGSRGSHRWRRGPAPHQRGPFSWQLGPLLRLCNPLLRCRQAQCRWSGGNGWGPPAAAGSMLPLLRWKPVF
jgi:hypothetical protein